MGGTQTIVFPSGEKFKFDDREYYSGRGSKYNSSIKHDLLGEVIVTESELKAALKADKLRQKEIARLAREAKAKAKRIALAKADGVYSIRTTEYGQFIELSEEESYGKHFDADRLAKTLQISVEDALLLNSIGKTYVFAKSADGNTYQLYHPSLFVNHLSISFQIATPELIAQFVPEEWQSAPYSREVGQTPNFNHFVC